MNAKEGVQNGAGIPDDKASETGAGLTSPQTNPTEHTIDLKATYHDPRDPDKPLTGEEVLQEMSRGVLLRRVESKLHKEIADLTVQAEEGKKAMALNTGLQTELDSIKQRELVRSELESLNLKSQSKPADEQLWPDDEEKKTVEFDSEYVLERMAKIEANITKKYEDTAESSLRKILAQDKEKQAAGEARQKRIDDFVNRAQASDLASYKAAYPTASEQDLMSVINTKTTASELASLARRAEAEGDAETSEEAYIQARARETEALMALADVREKDAQQQQKLEHQEQIELLTRGGPPGTEVKREREFNPKKAEENRKARLEKAREAERLGERNRNV